MELARPLTLAIESRAASARGATIIVEGGTRLGIDRTWRAELVDAKDREMVEVTVAELGPERIEVLAPISVERVANFAHGVRFTPPPNTRQATPPPAARPDPVVARITKRGQSTERGTRIVVGTGTRDGIDQTWRVVVLDAQGRPLPGGAVVGRVEAIETELFVRLTPDEIETRARTVRFTPH